MPRKIEISYVESPNEKERIEKITEIISEAVYTYLKKQGLLREDPNKSEKLKSLLKEIKEISNNDEESE